MKKYLLFNTVHGEHCARLCSGTMLAMTGFFPVFVIGTH